LAKLKPYKSEFRYDNDDYQSRFFAQDTTTYYYSGRLGKCISQINSTNKFECEDYSVSTDTILSYKEYETNEKILGQKCKIIEWQGKYFYNIFYVSTDMQIAPTTYKNHVSYNWKFYGEKSKGGLILKSEHRFKNYTMKGIAVSMKEEKNDFTSLNIDTTYFELNCKLWNSQKARTANIGFCASVAGHTNISQLQIQAVVRAGQTSLNILY
jgi:hypothetical protein